MKQGINARWFLAIVVLALMASSCTSDDASNVPGVEVQAGYTVSLVADGFDRPTQIAFTSAGDLVVAELAGEEDSGLGQVLLIPADEIGSNQVSSRQVLQENLAKPTGIAVVGETLWIMQERSLSFAAIEPGEPLQALITEMPFNGRSQGSLTVSPSGDLIYDTSGAKRGADVVPGSGQIFMISDADPIQSGQAPSEPKVIASGLKHGYAHTFDADNQLWATEMTDGTFDEREASDELVKVSIGDDFDWPACVENNRPVIEFGGSAERCSLAPPSHALFLPRATPTSVEVAPWDDEVLIVALWVTDQVVAIPLEPQANGEPWDGQEIVSGIGRPQDLLVDGERLLLTDHENGRILAIERT